jgi:putative sigma-54 modulation protein
MRLQIESPHFEVNQKLIELVENKFDHLGRIYKRINHCDIVLRREKNSQQNSYCIEIKVEVPGAILYAKENEKSFQSALRNALENLEHQLRKGKEGF